MRTWDQIEERERKQIREMLSSLKKFSHEFDRLDKIAHRIEGGSKKQRFYLNALFQHRADYIMVQGANRLRDSLKRLECEDLLEEVEVLLATSLGDTTFETVIRTLREKLLVHQSSDFDDLQRDLVAQFDFTKPENEERISGLVYDLFDQTQVLYARLAERYPAAITTE